LGNPGVATGNLRLSPGQLPNGIYNLTSKIGVKIKITQACPTGGKLNGTASTADTASAAVVGREDGF
jgi:hypothetical protein